MSLLTSLKVLAYGLTKKDDPLNKPGIHIPFLTWVFLIVTAILFWFCLFSVIRLLPSVL